MWKVHDESSSLTRIFADIGGVSFIDCPQSIFFQRRVCTPESLFNAPVESSYLILFLDCEIRPEEFQKTESMMPGQDFWNDVLRHPWRFIAKLKTIVFALAIFLSKGRRTFHSFPDTCLGLTISICHTWLHSVAETFGLTKQVWTLSVSILHMTSLTWKYSVVTPRSPNLIPINHKSYHACLEHTVQPANASLWSVVLCTWQIIFVATWASFLNVW